MTAPEQSVTRSVPGGQGEAPAAGGVHPATMARIVLWGLVVINLAIVEVMFWTYEPAKNPLIGVARFLGLHAALVMILQLVLIARRAVAGPADRHGPADLVAPVDRVHALLARPASPDLHPGGVRAS